jgi:hypothetical protein
MTRSNLTCIGNDTSPTSSSHVDRVIVGADDSVLVSPGLMTRITMLASPTDAP